MYAYIRCGQGPNIISLSLTMEFDLFYLTASQSTLFKLQNWTFSRMISLESQQGADQLDELALISKLYIIAHISALRLLYM